MYCPYCKHTDSRVVDSRTTDDGAAIRRRRQCTACSRRFTTVETTTISVIKRSGVTEPFDRSKIAAGVRKACQGRPVGEDDLAKLAQEVEELIRARGLAEINAHEVGLTILEPLSKLDAVAYLRFASVYQAFENLEDFESAIALLREDRVGDAEPPEDAVASSDKTSQDKRNKDAKPAKKNTTKTTKARSGKSNESNPLQGTFLCISCLIPRTDNILTKQGYLFRQNIICSRFMKFYRL